MITLDDIAEAGGYSIIYADPPWSYVQKGRGSTEKHYKTMSQADLCALPVSRLASRDAVLFLWATMPLLPEALEVGRAWSFDFKTVAFTWVKYREPSGKLAFGGGMWTRANAELCLLFVRGEPPRRVSAAVAQLVETWPNEETLCNWCIHPRKSHLKNEPMFGTGCIGCGPGGCAHECRTFAEPDDPKTVLRAPRGQH
ncbi:MAG: MT-A70 family methyltransferase, partial [Polyangiaceae bacterium]